MNSERALCLLVVIPLFLALVGCSKNSEPEIEQLVLPNVPTFGGARDRSYVTPSAQYLLEGECDSSPANYGLQYMFNNSGNWIELVGGCRADSRFAINVAVNPRKNVNVRAKSKYGFTDSSHAFIRIVLPPTAPNFSMAVSALFSEIGEFGHSGVMSYSWTGLTMNGGARRMTVDTLGIVYEQY